MTAPGSSSKWGSFFQQAVAGVEARLDNMLAEGEYAPDAVRPASQTPASDETKTAAAALAAQPPTSRPHSRLQERLAKAVGNKSCSITTAARVESPTGQNEGVTNAEDQKVHPQMQSTSPTPTLREEGKARDDIQFPPISTERPSPEDPDDVMVRSTGEGQSPRPVSSRTSPLVGPLPATQLEDDPVDIREPDHGGSGEHCSSCNSLRNRFRTLEAKLAEVELQGRKEHHTYVERADALESKLKYMTREMTESARKTAADAAAGNVEKRIAEKDEKIALLMSEGQTLAATEHKLRSIIKKLRSDLSERDKALRSLRDDNGKLEVQLEPLRNAESAAESLRSEVEIQKAKVNALQQESNSLVLESSAKDEAIKSLKLELDKAASAPGSEGAPLTEPAAEGGKRVAELDELVATLRTEKEWAAEKAQVQIDELRKKADAANEQRHQMKSELQTLEGKLEAMRVIAEEASSNATGDAQAKLLRQIETLQSQYATACENWQGIENTLTSRIAVLEKERDEINRKETETRKKARDLSSQSRQQAEDMRLLRVQIQDYQQERDASQRDLAQLRRKLGNAEAALKKFDEQQPPSREVDDKARRGTFPDAIPSYMEQHSPRIPGRPISPLHSPLRTWSSELLAPHPTTKSSRPGSVASASFDVPGRFGSPRDPTCPRAPGSGSDPFSPPVPGKPYLAYDTPMDPVAEPLSPQGQYRDDASDDNGDALSTVHRAIPDIASVSTTAAGPSIQLVERMSAGIRRLEAEKVAGREELLRISNQRDEARAEIVTLMKEIESSRQASDRVAVLEQEVAEINERYQTTLELLGEKSELVEELRADVQDVKAMYRELVERTIR